VWPPRLRVDVFLLLPQVEVVLPLLLLLLLLLLLWQWQVAAAPADRGRRRDASAPLQRRRAAVSLAAAAAHAGQCGANVCKGVQHAANCHLHLSSLHREQHRLAAVTADAAGANASYQLCEDVTPAECP